MNGRRFLARAWRALASLRAAGVAARRAIALIVAASLATARAQGQGTNWSSPSGDAGAMRWSPLTQVNTGNVARLVPAWTWKTGEKAIPAGPNQKPARPGQLQVSPVVINDTMYLSTSYAAVAALEAATGKLIWRYDPEVWRAGQPSNGTGFVHRGISTWSDGRERRVFINARWRLVALDARTGKPIPAFGRNGEINLLDGLRRKVNPLHYTNTSPSLVVGDLVIVGNGVGDRLRYPNDPPGDVQAFDVRTGKRAWSFHTIPDSGEFGWQTWEKGSWKYMGHTNVWAPMSADTARGLVFLPVSTPTNDWYGGDRLGDNLFAEAVVALDAKTGVRRWHFQTVHHGLWSWTSRPSSSARRWPCSGSTGAARSSRRRRCRGPSRCRG
ncbi:MAG: PQQ-binding-like beta-propeller repeat protein [Gemmatimonadetes bacterium]|nr:PQQ-binding-like beta-propeller repeat protein [Gemmatimonadota bacterium]